MRIEPIDKKTFLKEYFELLGEVELGDCFNPKLKTHRDWILKRIDILYFQGIKLYTLLSDNGYHLGFYGIHIEERLEGIPYTGHYSELLDIAVFQSKRGKGLGKKLLNHAEALAKKHGAHCLYMSTYAKEYKVISFYGKNEFIPVATMPDVHGPTDEGRVWMRKLL